MCVCVSVCVCVNIHSPPNHDPSVPISYWTRAVSQDRHFPENVSGFKSGNLAEDCTILEYAFDFWLGGAEIIVFFTAVGAHTASWGAWCEVLRAVTVSSTEFWNVAPSSLVVSEEPSAYIFRAVRILYEWIRKLKWNSRELSEDGGNELPRSSGRGVMSWRAVLFWWGGGEGDRLALI